MSLVYEIISLPLVNEILTIRHRRLCGVVVKDVRPLSLANQCAEVKKVILNQIFG